MRFHSFPKQRLSRSGWSADWQGVPISSSALIVLESGKYRVVTHSDRLQREGTMSRQVSIASLVLAFLILIFAGPSRGQLKPQWMPGQVGLNAGILPSPGFSYVEMNINYNAGTFNGPQGNAVPVTGTYDVWAVENIFYYVPPTKIMGGNVGIMIMP